MQPQHIGMFAVACEIMGQRRNQQPEEHDGADECGGNGNENGDQHEDDRHRSLVVHAKADGRCAAERKDVERVQEPQPDNRHHADDDG